jgi:hypothetical protein
MSFGELGGHFGQSGVIPLSLTTKSGDDGRDIPTKNVVKQWQDLMA